MLIFAPLAGYDEPEILLKQNDRSVSRSLTGNTLEITSDNGGKLLNPDMPGSAINYSLLLDGQDIDLASTWTIANRARTDLDGVSLPMTVTIEESERVFAGEHSDRIVFRIITQ